MAKKIKRGFGGILPWSVVIILILAVSVGLLNFLPKVQPALAADTILTSVYVDNDSNGTVDRIVWTMDENVTACAYDVTDWSVDTAGDFNLSVTNLSCTGTDAILNILVSADTDETGSATDPVVSYTNNANRITHRSLKPLLILIMMVAAKLIAFVLIPQLM
jgi:hypothetical protein